MPYINFEQLEQLDATIAADNPVSWQSFALSHAGRVREVNEDAFFNSAELGLWAVADGMGGLARGDYASSVVVDALVHFYRLPSLAASVRDLEMRLREAHGNCRSSFQGERVGSTVAALFSYRNYVFLLWAGDSRVYRLRDGALTQMTTDHTVAQEKCARGELSAFQANMHPSAHVLTRAVGVHQTLHLELDYHTVQKGDRYLLCSDGLYDELGFDDIQALLTQNDGKLVADSLVAQALDNGGRDNITALVVEAT